jgi:hypothetical protein
MARARRKQGQVDAGEGKPIARATVKVCPLCSITPEDEISTHLQGHAPAEPCRHCGEKHTGWKVDWDGVMYPRPDVSLFFCDPCGVFFPVEPESREEVSPSGEVSPE